MYHVQALLCLIYIFKPYFLSVEMVITEFDTPERICRDQQNYRDFLIAHLSKELIVN